MADEEGGAAGGTTAHEEKKHTKQQRMLIIIGVVSLVLVYVMMRRSSSSGASGQTAAQQSALAQYEAQLASQSYGSQQGAYANNAADPVLMQMLQALGTIQSEVATMQPSGTPSSAATPTPSGYKYITDPAVGSALTKAGVPVFMQLGPPSQGGPIIPFQPGIAPAGSSELYQA